MILFIDITNERSRVGLIAARRAIWRSAPGRDALMTLLTAAKRARRIPARGATFVLAALSAPGSVRDASWSAVRGAVAAANALSFAWGVPATTALLRGDEPEDVVAAIARVAAKRAGKGSRASAVYDGEPHITKPKAS